MSQNPYQNLTQDELDEADHYAETGNREGLRNMQQRSAARDNDNRAAWHQTSREPQWD